MQFVPCGLCDGGKVRFIPQQVVQARGKVEPFFQRRDKHLFPCRRNHPAPVGDPDHQRLDPGGLCVRKGHVGQSKIGLAAVHPKLTKREIGAPILDALGNLGGKPVRGIAKEQKIRGLDHGSLRQLVGARVPRYQWQVIGFFAPFVGIAARFLRDGPEKRRFLSP